MQQEFKSPTSEVTVMFKNNKKTTANKSTTANAGQQTSKQTTINMYNPLLHITLQEALLLFSSLNTLHINNVCMYVYHPK